MNANIKKQVEVELCYLERIAAYLNENLKTNNRIFYYYLISRVSLYDCLFIDLNGRVQIDRALLEIYTENEFLTN